MSIGENFQALLALGLLAAVLAGFLSERWPPAVVAATGAAAFILTGLVSTNDVVKVFSNSAPVTIAAMFILSGALVRTGTLEAVSNFVLDRARTRTGLTLAVVVGGTIIASAFMNNTPLVMVLIPLVMRLAGAISVPASRLLIPLSYAAILGGTCTLIGTSTNLVVDTVARDLGLARFGMFEITPVGVVAALTGGAYMLLAGRFLLPDRPDLGTAHHGGAETYLTEVVLGEGFEGIGKPYGELIAFNRPDSRILAIKRRTERVRTGIAGEKALAGDRLVLMAPASEILTLAEHPGLTVGTRQRARLSANPKIVEALVSPRSSGPTRLLSDYNLPARFGVTPLAVRRHGHIPGSDLATTRLRGADVLLLAGPEECFTALRAETDIVSLADSGSRGFRRGRAPLALVALGLVVVLAAFDVMPIAALALIAAALLMFFRCIDLDEATESIDGGVLILIFAMLAIGAGLDNTGAVQLVTNAVAPFIDKLGPVGLLICAYALTSFLTEVVTNNAVAVIVTPLVVGLAQSAGIDPRPFVIAVMFGASASFATPIGYQTNTLVYAAGNYRFADFIRVGLPMNIVVGIATCVAIATFYGLW